MTCADDAVTESVDAVEMGSAAGSSTHGRGLHDALADLLISKDQAMEVPD